MARQESVAPLNPATACLSIKIRDAEPEMSRTFPISSAEKLTGTGDTFATAGFTTGEGASGKGLLATNSDTNSTSIDNHLRRRFARNG